MSTLITVITELPVDLNMHIHGLSLGVPISAFIISGFCLMLTATTNRN